MARVNSGGVEIVYDILNANAPGVPIFFIAGLNGMRAALTSCARAAASSGTPRTQALMGAASGSWMTS